MNVQRNAVIGTLLSLFFVLVLLLLAPATLAMETLSETELAEESGAGLALALDDFSFRMAPTSYIELTGTAPENTSTPSAASLGWKRADARYYGLSFTSNSTASGTDWYGNGCTPGATGLGCPMGSGAIADLAPVYNPYLLRVYQYQGFDYQGTLLCATCGTGSAESRPTVLELIGPSASDTWRWAFWGEIEIARGTTYATSTSTTTTSPHPGNPAVAGCLSAGNGNASYCGLQSQSVILGKPITRNGTPAILRLMQTSNTADLTLGLTYQSALSGDFRFTAMQTAASPNVLHAVPDFHDLEGIYFRHVDAFLPLGRLNSQAIVFDSTASGATAGDGNFVIQLMAVPNVANVYNDIYCGSATPVVVSCTTSTVLADFFGNTVTEYNNPNPATHGYVKWGCMTTDNTGPCSNGGSARFPTAPITTASDNGIYFTNATGTVVNIGTAKLDGILIQSLKFTTKGL
ncbi:MAG: hypothetical protein K0R03_192 [Moraxellaceae bacterium]|jgi:hypothetical protein|nr:hypothetical protein [Moraxellaceae bacterium]